MNAARYTSLIRIRIRILILSLVALGPIVLSGCKKQATPAGRIDQSDFPIITAKTPPHEVAREFTRALQTFLQYEHEQPPRAKRAITFAASLIADKPARQAIKIDWLQKPQMTPEEINKIKQAVVWAGLINFYTGHILDPKVPSAPATQTANRLTAEVRLPTKKQGPTAPVEIVLTCTKNQNQNNIWKVKSVILSRPD